MLVYADTHVHLYPCYDLSRAFDSAWENFSKVSAGNPGLFVLYLTERSDCNFFDQLAGNPTAILGKTSWQVSILETPEVLLLKGEGEREMFLVAGRQIKTEERLEILVLHTRRQFPDGGAIASRLDALLREEDLVILNWSLGKWMFERAGHIARAIENSSCEKLQIGDILGRPRVWGEPKLFRFAAERNFKFLAGSDPLPFAGEEDRLGAYVSRIEVDTEGAEALRNRWFFRDILLGPQSARSVFGVRNSIPDTLWRFIKNFQAGKGAS